MSAMHNNTFLLFKKDNSGKHQKQSENVMNCAKSACLKKNTVADFNIYKSI